MWEKNKEKDIDELAMEPRTAVGCRQNHPYHPCIANCTVYIHVWSNMVQYGPYLQQLGDLCSK